MIQWPAILPIPQASDYQVKQRSNLVTTDMDSGYTRVRAKFKHVPSHIQVVYKCLPDKAALFEGFVTHLLTGGSAKFETKLLFATGVQNVVGQFITNPLEQSKLVGSMWQYSATLEVDRPSLDAVTVQWFIDNELVSVNPILDTIKKAITP
jgi:hypothetical protein